MSAAPNARQRTRWGSALFWASLAAWAAYMAFALLGAIVTTYIFPGGRSGMVEFALALAVFVLPIALVLGFLVGGPALIFAEAFRLSRWWHAAAVGAVSGLLALLLLSLLIQNALVTASTTQIGVSLAVFAMIGACSGVTAWFSLWLDGRYRLRARNSAE